MKIIGLETSAIVQIPNSAGPPGLSHSRELRVKIEAVTRFYCPPEGQPMYQGVLPTDLVRYRWWVWQSEVDVHGARGHWSIPTRTAPASCFEGLCALEQSPARELAKEDK